MGSTPEPIKIVCLQAGLVPVPEDLNLPIPFELVTYPDTAPDQVAERIAPATVILASSLALTSVHLSESNTPHLRLVSVMQSGTDHIDVKTCRKRGVVVCNASEAIVTSVAEHTLGLYFAVRRAFRPMEAAFRANQWPVKGNLFGVTLDPEGKLPMPCEEEVVGIVGYGPLGKGIARLFQALGMSILVAERRGASDIREGRHAFEDVVRKCTVLILALPKTPESTNLVDAAELKMMQPAAIVVNVARGGIVNEAALLEALRERRIAGAGVDVFETEPAGPDTTVLLSEEAKALNLVVTPHLAWASRATGKNVKRITKANVEAWAKGQPQNVVAGLEPNL